MFTCACDSHGGVFTATLSESRDTVTQFPCPTRRMADTANGKTATYHDGEVWVFFCETHYQNWIYCQDNWRYQFIPDVPRSFANNITRFVQILTTRDFQLGYKLAAIVPKLLDADLDDANVYALDTEFHHLQSGHIEVAEVAIVAVKTGRIIVNAVLDHSRAGLVETKMNKFLRIQQQDPSSPQHVLPVYTAACMMKQLEDCYFKESDVFVEYSKSSALPDLSLIRSVIEGQEDYDAFRPIPGNNGFAIIPEIKALLSRALPLPSYSLQFIFRLLFPQDPLVDCNHSAAIDSLQLARILQLAAELAKKPWGSQPSIRSVSRYQRTAVFVSICSEQYLGSISRISSFRSCTWSRAYMMPSIESLQVPLCTHQIRMPVS
jgi:hypothetical protein